MIDPTTTDPIENLQEKLNICREIQNLANARAEVLRHANPALSFAELEAVHIYEDMVHVEYRDSHDCTPAGSDSYTIDAFFAPDYKERIQAIRDAEQRQEEQRKADEVKQAAARKLAEDRALYESLKARFEPNESPVS